MAIHFGTLVRDSLKVIDITMLFSLYNPDLQRTIGRDYWGTAVNLLLLGFILVYASMLVEHYLEKHEGRSVWFGVVFYGVIFLLIAAVIYFKLLG
jgi:hypothetical protein